MAIERILKAVEREPWMVAPSKLEAIGAVLVAKAESGQIASDSDIDAADARQRGRTVSAGGAVAVLPMFGTISRRMGMLGAMSGGMSIETFSRQFADLVNDEQIAAIIIDVDSPGGSVYGVEELSRQIFDARKHKRIVAVADQLMASAAYYIGSAADELVVTPSGEVGSIGVYTIHFDWSGHLEQQGVKATIIKAGPNKAEGNPYEALGEDAADHIQMIVDDYYNQFLRAVARNRGVSVKKVRDDFGGGRTYTAKRALERGMVDRIATMDTIIGELRGPGSAGKSASALPVVVAGSVDLAAADWAPGIVVAGAPNPAVIDRGPTAGLACDPEDQLFGEVAPLIEGVLAAAKSAEGPDTDEPDEELDAGEAETETDSTADGGRAADSDSDAPNPNTTTAPVAMEEPVEKVTAAPDAGAVSAEDAIANERVRAQEIRSIVAAHAQIDDAKANEWVEAGLSVDAVRAEALRLIGEAAAIAPDIRVGTDHEAARPYVSLGHQLQDIASAAKHPDAVPKQLLHVNAEALRIIGAASGANVSVPSDGGFVVQADFAEEITQKMWEEGKVLSRTNRVPISSPSNALVRNQVKENSRATGSRYGGVRVYRTNEAGTVAASLQKLTQQRIELEKLFGLYYATEEILQDAAALTVEAERAFRKELTFVAENEVFRGTGAGQMLGFLISDALVSVAAESGQAAATIQTENTAKMMARLPAGSFGTAVWLINASVLPQLVAMTTGNQPVFLPGGNVSGAPFGTLWGIPIDPVEYCAALGTLGDIVLVDLDQYTTIEKGGANWQESIHVRFLQDETTFKLTTRINGQPDWETSVTPFQGTDNISPFIALATRS